MKILDTSYKPEQPNIQIKAGYLFECALGIAMITYPKLHGDLEKSREEIAQLRKSLSGKLEAELQYCQEHNTWKLLLQLLHYEDTADPEDFKEKVSLLDERELRYRLLPYLNEAQQANRRLAAEGNERARDELILSCRQHAFFPQLIDFVFRASLSDLKEHLFGLLDGWRREAAEDEESVAAIFRRDMAEKQRWKERVSPGELVQKACGMDYQPEHGLPDVLLIPHIIYRPWTIEAVFEGVKVFYYPVSDEALMDRQDPYQPPGKLVQLYKALADEKRLRIIKLLNEREMSLKELTETVELGKTTVHHHLSMLKLAGIVTVRGSMYSVNLQALNDTGKMFGHFLEDVPKR